MLISALLGPPCWPSIWRVRLVGDAGGQLRYRSSAGSLATPSVRRDEGAFFRLGATTGA